MAPTTRRGQNTPTSNTNPNNMTPESVQAMIDQALQRNSTNGDYASHSLYLMTEEGMQTLPLALLGAALNWWNGLEKEPKVLKHNPMTCRYVKKKRMDKYYRRVKSRN
ncbi:hypothetical protein Tco_0717469 [Tanacetum coccineum]